MSSRIQTGGWLVAAVLVSSWALSSASNQNVGERPVRPQPTAIALPDLSQDLKAHVDRLASHAWQPAVPVDAGRNPFTLAPTAPSRTAEPHASETSVHVSSETAAIDPGTVVPLAPRLSGLADLHGGALTAVISWLDELHYVKKGDVMGARYRVDAVSLDGVELFDLTLGTILRLSLQRIASNSHNVCAIRCSSA